MNKLFFFAVGCAVSTLSAVHFEPLFTNEQMRVAKVTISSHEEVEVAKGEYPQMVIALQDGSLSLAEEDGEKEKLCFSANAAFTQDKKLQEKRVTLFNESEEPLSFLIMQSQEIPPPSDENSNCALFLQTRIYCPPGEEFESFAASLPSPKEASTSFEEWKNSFFESLCKLSELIESGKVSHAWWSVKLKNFEKVLDQTED